ncbi:MAG TPA: hypothetical protein VG894_08270, partial [Bauldia sp.]|nr:hypothetical protein [Bauldia sp.]
MNSGAMYPTPLELAPPIFPSKSGLRRLKAAVLAAGLAVLAAGNANAGPVGYAGPCDLSATTVTCTGSEAANGVNIGDVGVTQLNVNGVTADVAPEDDSAGITLDTSNAASADVELGAHAVYSAGDGVYVSAWGDDTSASLTLGGDVESLGGKGVVVTGSGDVIANTTSNVSSDDDALTAKSWGGSVEVDQTGNLTSWEGRGLYAEGLGNDIDIEGNVDSLGDAVYSHSWGTDGITTILVNGTVNAREGSGVVVQEDNLDETDPENPVYGTADITVNGALTAHNDGISVTAEGAVTIKHTGTLTTDTGTGIYGNSSFGAVEIDQYGGALTAHGDAVVGEAYAVGSGVTINSTYDITSDIGRGVVATAAGGSVDLTLKGVTSKLDTIHAEAGNSGTVQINADGDVTSYAGSAIYATSLHSSVDVTVTNGDVTSKLDAIYLAAGNSNTAHLQAGNVTSYDGKGITATSFNGSTNLTAGAVTAKLDAITATGPGGNTINTGDIVSYDGAGVIATSTGSSSTQSLTLGDVTSKLEAIDAEAAGTVNVGAHDITSYDDAGVFAKSTNGSATVNVYGVTSKLDAIHAEGPAGVTVTADGVVSYDGVGVFAKASAWNANASVTTDDVTGKQDAIHTEATSGIATVIAGNVTSYDGAGVYAFAGKGAVGVTTEDVTSELDAIHADGTTTATVQAGDVTSYNGNGVYAKGGDGDVSVTTGDVNSEFDAIYAETVSNGKVTVQAGDVDSAEGIGIHAKSVLDLVNVTAGDVTSEQYAVSAISGNGSSTVDVDNVFSYEGLGIYATAANGFVEVTADGNVTANQDAITAESANGDDGHVDVNVTGDVKSDDGQGVIANTVNGAVDVEIGGKVTSKGDAVDAQSNNGSVTVKAAGGLLSYDGKGVDASSENGAVSVVIGTDTPPEIADVTSKLDAITAQTNSGTASVDVTGSVQSYDGKAIYAESDTSAVTVAVGGNVTSKLDSIYAQSDSGSSADLLDVEVGGNLTSYDGQGIQALAANGRVKVKVDGDTETKLDAITASTTGGDAASTVAVNTGGAITSYDGSGIVASSANSGVTITSTGAVTTKIAGIYARSTGGDANASIDINQTGHLISWSGVGIDALSTGGPVSVTTSGGIEADQDAIVAESQGGDDIGTVTVKNTSGKIVSNKGNGVTATATRDGVSVDVTGDIDADQNGISATSTGETETSGVTVQETGKITVANGSGIYVNSLADAGVTLDGEISGGAHGIDATSLAGAVTATIDDEGKISGSSGAGVHMNSYTTATLNNYGDLSSAYGPAFEIDGDGTGTVNNYGTISGNFSFDAAAGTFNNMADAVYNAGDEMDFLGGGTFNNSGLLSMSTDSGDSPLQNTYLNGDYVQTDAGTLRTDIRFSDNWSDRLVVSGTADLAGLVSVNVSGDLFDGIDKDFKILTA